MTNSSAPRSRWQKWLRRILRGVMIILGLLAVIAAIAPSLLFNRRVELWISRTATGFLGRPVVVEDIAFGWRTPLHAGRISLPPVAGEGDYPLVDIRGVSIPITLAKIAMLPPYSISIGIDKIEFNLVKKSNGELNLTSLMASLGGGAAKKKTPAPKSNGPASLPLKDLRVDVRKIDIRYVDKTKGMIAGWEAGSVFLNWPGGNRPLEGKIAGNILLNETRLPWELGIDLRSWINAERVITLDSTELTVDSGGGTNAPVYLNVSMATGRQTAVHVALPLALVTQVGGALNLPIPLPELAGGLDLRLTASHAGDFRNWHITSALLINNIKVTGTPSQVEREPLAKSPKAEEVAASTNAPAASKGFDGTLGIAGRITLDTAVAIPPPTTGAAAPWQITGSLVTEVNSLDLVAGKTGVSVCDFFDRRRFEVTLDPAVPANLTYADDAHTGLSSVEGTMGVTVGKCSLAAKARFTPPGIASYNIGSAEINDVIFTSPALQVSVPPVQFSGGVSANLKDSTVEAKNLRLVVGSFFDSSFNNLLNWTNGELRIAADMNLSSLSNALAIVQIHSTGTTVALPQLSGGISGSVNLHGRLPKAAFKIGDPLPVAGEAQLSLVDVGVTMGQPLSIHGINAVAKLGLPEDGRDIITSLNLRVAETVAGGGKIPPIENIHLEASAAIHDFDKLEAELKGFGIESLGTTASSHLSVGGLLACMSTNLPGTGAVKWLHALPLEVAATFGQELKAISGIVTNLDCSGKVGVSVSFKNSPQQSLAATASLNIDNLNLNLADKVRIDGVHGAWKATKTFLAPGRGRKPVSPPPGRIMIDSVTIAAPKLPLGIHKTVIEFQGAEQGMAISVAIPDMIGGPTEALCSLSIQGGNPALSAKITTTGINGGSLMPGLEFKNKGDGDINAVADVSLVLPRDMRGTLLDYLDLRVRTMRIGKSALVRIMQAMDSRQETPQFQNAITALSLGTPVGAEFSLANSLITINAELLLAGGVRVSLPVLDSAPLGDIMGVYKLEGTDQKLDGLRNLLLLLLSDDLAELEKSLSRDPQ